MTRCVFCDIIAGRAPASLVYQDDQVVAFMDTRPVNAGHVLVVPRTHAASLAEMEPETGGVLFRTGMRLGAALRRSGLNCEGINLYVADRATAGQEVFHVHLHVLPRFPRDGFGFRFPPGYGHHPSRQMLDEQATAIRGALV